MKGQILVKDGKGERIAPQVLCEYLMLASPFRAMWRAGSKGPCRAGALQFLNGLQSLVDWKSGAHIE